VNVLSVNVKKLVYNNKWDEEEKNTVENTYVRYIKILQLNIHDNNFDKTATHK